MLYIDDIGNNTIRFGNAQGGGSYPKFLSKPLYAESDLLGRVWIKDGYTGINYLNCYDPSQITLEGTVYEVDDFVSEFNLLATLLNPFQPYFSLPSTGLTLIAGQEITLFGDELINWPLDSDFTVDYTCAIGTESGNNLVLAPTTANIGNHNLTISFKKTGVEFLNQIIQLSVIPAMEYWGRKILCIGDSILDDNFYYEYPEGTPRGSGYAMVGDLPTNGFTFIGTQGVAGWKNEGKSGASIHSCVTGLWQPSVFVKAGVLNIPAYFADNSLDTPDIVHIRLGVNDTFFYSQSTQAFPDSQIEATLLEYDTFINAFLNYNSDLQIIVSLPTNATSVAARWGYDTSLYPQNKYIENIHRFWIKLIERYANGAYNARVDMSYEAINIDRDAGYTNGLHMTFLGDTQIGTGIAPYINKALYNIVNVNKVAYYDGVDASTMTLDGSSKVQYWGDKFRAIVPRLGQNASNSYRPTPGLQGVEFDGSDDYMNTDTFVFSQPAKVYLLIKQVSWVSGDKIFDGFANRSMEISQGTTTPDIRAFGGTSSSANEPNLAVGVWGIVIALFSGANSKMQVNDNAALTGSWGTTAPAGIAIPWRASVLVGQITYREIIVKSTDDSAANEAAIYDHLVRIKAAMEA